LPQQVILLVLSVKLRFTHRIVSNILRKARRGNFCCGFILELGVLGAAWGQLSVAHLIDACSLLLVVVLGLFNGASDRINWPLRLGVITVAILFALKLFSAPDLKVLLV
jgi:hypothetical protein